jgi:hypothetical protein
VTGEWQGEWSARAWELSVNTMLGLSCETPPRPPPPPAVPAVRPWLRRPRLRRPPWV